MGKYRDWPAALDFVIQFFILLWLSLSIPRDLSLSLSLPVVFQISRQREVEQNVISDYSFQ